MKYLKSYKVFESKWTPEDILKELSLELTDAGLQVNIYTGQYKYSNHPKFDGDIHVEITDKNKLFCKNYPEDDGDWLYGKSIINSFLQELEDFGFVRDKDYKVYGGGLSVNIVFGSQDVVKLESNKVFESKCDSIRQDIEDICLEFDDIDISYTIREINYYPDEDQPKDALIIEIQDVNKRFFRLEDIEDVIFRIRQYLNNKNFLIDLSIPKEDCYMSIDSFWREFSGEELYDLHIYIYYHQRIINESTKIEQEIYQQVLNTIKDCFIEFEDNRWTWIGHPTTKSMSIYEFPNFNCRMMPKEDDYAPSELRDYIDMTGEISSDGEIDWDTQELDFNDETLETEKTRVREEFDDFLVAIKRIQSETGLGFRFSYNNKGGEKRIIIQGSV